MNPTFTLQYSEFATANQLQNYFPQSEGFSIFVPASRQEKGIDLILVQKRPKRKSRVVTFQIKSSRTYEPKTRNLPITNKVKYKTWFNHFCVQDAADYYILFTTYFKPQNGNKNGVILEQQNLLLLLTNREMGVFLGACLTKSGNTDKFGFGFNDEKKIVQTRGNPLSPRKDLTRFLLHNRIDKLRKHFGGHSIQMLGEADHAGRKLSPADA